MLLKSKEERPMLEISKHGIFFYIQHQKMIFYYDDDAFSNDDDDDDDVLHWNDDEI